MLDDPITATLVSQQALLKIAQKNQEEIKKMQKVSVTVPGGSPVTVNLADKIKQLEAEQKRIKAADGVPKKFILKVDLGKGKMIALDAALNAVGVK